MTMTDTEAKALALVNEVAVDRGGAPVDFYALQDDIIAIALCRAIERLEATEASHAAELRAAEERETALRKDLKRAEVEEVIAHCEGCSAPLLSNDDFVSDDDCVYGCWAAMTDAQPHRERPCYAYRVGKPAARQALAGAKP